MNEYPPEVCEYLEQVRQGTQSNNPQWESLHAICIHEELTKMVLAPELKEFYPEETWHCCDENTACEVLTGKGELALLTRASQPSSKFKPATANQRMADLVLKDPSLASLTAEQWAAKCGCSAANIKQTATWKKIMKNRAQCRDDRVSADKDRHIR